MRLIVITPENDMLGETAIVNELFKFGLQKLHLRKPAYTKEEYGKYISEIDEQYHNRIVLCGHFELLDDHELCGIHLNSEMRNDSAVWQQIRKITVNTLSTSFHSWQELLENEVFYSYVLISPVFDSISKQGYKAAIDLAGASATKKKLNMMGERCPAIIGLGGVGAGQITTLNQYGFHGAAMLGGIWQAEDPLQAFGDVMKVINAL
ncbi:MAG: hypothetical protein K0Q79_2782 [Flavipsychrobacter sp.]|jgi:thiamine-phosphate pyrophosphorylase|nr:hypothetical protein [Flavipsychrobacter sp.]